MLGQRIHALFALGRLGEAHEVISLVHTVAAEQGDDEVQGGAALVLGQLALERGRVAEALEWLREASTVLGRFDPQSYLPWCHGLVASASALVGDAPGAEAAATEAERLASTSPVHVLDVRVALGRAHALAVGGDRTRASTVAVAAADRCEAAGDRFGAAVALEAALELGAAPGPLAERLGRLAADGQVPWTVLWRDHARALADGDGNALEAVAARYAELGVELRAARASEHAAVAHERAGLRARATRARGRAAQHLSACVGVSPSTGAEGSLVARLTRRELEVVRLAADGCSNAQIAGRLSLGVRTVEGHLLRATTKLGVRGRAELTALLGGEPA